MSGQTIILNSFNTGEMSPKVWARTDLAKSRNAATTMRNFFVDYRGGAVSRAGTRYIGMCKQAAPNPGGVGSINNPPRFINFQFSIFQGYVLEFGHQYMRIISEGAYITETGKAITLITNANPAILQIIGHGFSVGDSIFISGVGGMANFNGLVWVVSNVIDVNNINVTDLFGTPVDSTGFPAFTTAGTAERIYTVVSPYAAADLPYLKFTQSADVMTLCCVNQQTLTEYSIYDLQRFGNTNWQFGVVSFSASIGPPANPIATAFSSTTVDTNYGYVVTAVDATTSEESIPSGVASVGNNNISINAGSNTVTWNAVPGAGQYNIYETTPAYQPGSVTAPGLPFGYVGTATGTTFTDSNITPDFTTPPPMHINPFAIASITGGIVNTGGSGYTDDNIGYVINTVTGSGALLILSTSGGALSGIAVASGGGGVNYDPLVDTITITSGGAGPPVRATGSYTFVNNPTVGQSIVLNGHSIVFQKLPTQPGVGGTLALTLQNMVNWIATAGIAALNLATYSISGSVLNITYKTTGLIGNTYTLAAGTYGGVISGATLAGGSDGGGVGGSGATATLTFNPASGNTPSVVAYYQQRRVYANTLNQPDTYFMSKPGAYENMDSSTPTVASDSITGTPWAQQVNGVQFLVPMQSGLIILTGNGTWLLNGGTNAAITPADQTATPQIYVGCAATVPPITIDYDVLYVQSKGSIVRDLAFNFLFNVFTGVDRTVLSSQLFDNHSIVEWTYAQEPNKIVWCVREDGIMLSLTYLKEQDIYGWARHDTNGLFVTVTSITERHLEDVHSATGQGPLTDAVYTGVKRFIKGQWVYYTERFDDRNWFASDDCWCVDAGLAYPQTFPNAYLQVSASTGTGVTFTADSSVFSAGNIGDVIRTGGGIVTVTGFTSGTQVTGRITQTIAETVPNDPNSLPIPQPPGQWSIATPIGTVTGLNHLEGMTVTGLADGNVITPTVVTNGSIILVQPASSIVIGLAFLPQLQTMYLDPPNNSGTTQTKRKAINSVGVRYVLSRGFSVGTNQTDASTQQNGQTVAWSNLYEIKQNISSSNPTNSIPLQTDDYFINVSSGWNPKAQIAIQQNYPLPVNISGLIAYATAGDT